MSMRLSPILLKFAVLFLVAVNPVHADEPGTVLEILAERDRGLIRDLEAYLHDHPTAEDRDQAYLKIFETAIDNDWFTQTETTANEYLAANPEGAVRPMAQIVSTMARAQAGKYSEAWTVYDQLIQSLEGADQEEFAASFADALASEASGAGKTDVARQVYETLLKKYGDNPALRQKVQDDLARIDMVGKPAPVLAVMDLKGEPVRLADYQGKYLLVDFWATWCAPCLADLPKLQSAYKRYHDRGFDIISVSLDETPEAVSAFVKDRKIPWRQIHSPTSGGDLIAAYGVSNIPASFLIDPEGKVVRIDLRGEALGKALENLIK
ncbi:MAG TPA: TlpA disulfide reductase family protein [Isosphaeraceae bacterium]|nr:TlpA disulfide reductase family protein [Isosphaeraceae bacterium]